MKIKDNNRVYVDLRRQDMDWYALRVYRSAGLPEKGWTSNKVEKEK